VSQSFPYIYLTEKMPNMVIAFRVYAEKDWDTGTLGHTLI